MKLMLLLTIFCILIQAQILPGFKPLESFDEQYLVIKNSPANTRIMIHAPMQGFGKDNQVLLVFYALPNGNTIEQTFGKKLKTGDDWHFDIQHIGAQTRFLRNRIGSQTMVVVYLETTQKSWPSWASNTLDSGKKIQAIVDTVRDMFSAWNPQVVLNGHSGGGRFILSYINAVDEIPESIVRIAFLDSNYGYENTLHGAKLVRWLQSGTNKHLCVLAYNDSVVIYNGKPLVSPTGGTWYRSKLMQQYLSSSFPFIVEEKNGIIWNKALEGRIAILLKTNPDKLILHTRQVELNGFIHSMASGTEKENQDYVYFGKRAYSNLVADTMIPAISRAGIPPRNPDAESGSAFMKRISSLQLLSREEEIYKAISSGNIPDFLRNMVTLTGEFMDAAGINHVVSYEIMPDYLAVGSNEDFCRIPMNPYTAQRLASDFGLSLITAKISDHIFQKAEVKLNPFSYTPVGNANELVSKFIAHNAQIEKQLKAEGGSHGSLIAGIKKDVILSKRIAEQPRKVVIYGWHKADGKPIQPVYSGHADYYVDYSHGIRLIHNRVFLDGKPHFLSDILKDFILYKIFSNENAPMLETVYSKQ